MGGHLIFVGGAALLMDTFARLFPRAQFVLVTRETGALVSSLLDCNWVGQDGKRLAYTEDSQAAVRFVRNFMQLSMQNSVRARSAGRVLTLRYETLCAAPGQAMDRLGGFLGVGPPRPFIEEASAHLVTQTQGNSHPPLRPGPISRAAG